MTATITRVCKNTECGISINHLPEKFKYCTLGCRLAHNDKLKCKSSKKLSKCVVCGGKYDLLSRGRKRTCNEICETIHKERSSKKVYYQKKGNLRKCEKCGCDVSSKLYKLCGRCRAVEKEMNKFKESLG